MVDRRHDPDHKWNMNLWGKLLFCEIFRNCLRFRYWFCNILIFRIAIDTHFETQKKITSISKWTFVIVRIVTWWWEGDNHNPMKYGSKKLGKRRRRHHEKRVVKLQLICTYLVCVVEDFKGLLQLHSQTFQAWN